MTTYNGPDDGDNYCLTCMGKGGSIERQDPVGDGIGYETFLNPCPDCLGAGRCPWCGQPIDKEYNCANEACLWTPDQIDAPGSFDDCDDEPYPWDDRAANGPYSDFGDRNFT